MFRVLLAAAVTLTASAAAVATPPEPVAPAADAKSLDCIITNRIRRTEVRDDQTIDFQLNNGRWYRNILAYSCPSLGTERSFGYVTRVGQLCSIDTITVNRVSDPAVRGATCGLGPFLPIPAPGKPARKAD